MVLINEFNFLFVELHNLFFVLCCKLNLIKFDNRKLTDMADCATHSDELGPLGIDYQYLYSCELYGYEWLSWFCLLSWTVGLIYLLGDTASTYFSPTLGYICEKLKLPYNIAGVTFLAFGNGSPDVFSSLSAFSSGGSNVSIGVGALLGGSMFVCTIVVGSVAIHCPCQVNKDLFVRDICYYLLAVISLWIVSAISTLTIGAPIYLLVLYMIYVLIVLATWVNQESANASAKRRHKLHTSDRDIYDSNVVMQTAYWFPGNGASTTAHKIPGSTRDFTDSVQEPPHNSSHSDSADLEDMEMQPMGDFSGGYKFITLNEEAVDRDKSSDMISRVEGEEHSDDSDDDENGTITINLSGYSGGFNVDNVIQDDYFGGVDTECGSSGNDSLKQPLLSSSDTHTHVPKKSKHKSKHVLKNNKGIDEFAASTGRRVADQYYWNSIQLRRRLHHQLTVSNEFWCGGNTPIWEQIAMVLEYPAILARDLTIPTSDPELWNKYYAVAQPICGPLMFMRVTGVGSDPNVFWGMLLSGIGLSFVVWVLTHHSKPPTGVSFSIVWVLMGFVMCVVWIYTLAGELVSCLSAIGVLTRIPPAILGLTVLAWGNSVGDLFSNIAVAKQGLSELAISGCYGKLWLSLLCIVWIVEEP